LSPDGQARRITKITTGLPVGTQARFIAATHLAVDLGMPINHLLSNQWSKLFAFSAKATCLKMGEVERIVYLVELLRKWVTRRVVAIGYRPSRRPLERRGGQHLPSNAAEWFSTMVVT
jgi:hypothetical protein